MFLVIKITDQNYYEMIDFYYKDLNDIYKYLSSSATQLSLPDTRRVVEGKLKQKHEIYLLVDTTKNNKLVGTVTLIPEIKVYGAGKTVIHLEDLVVYPEYQGAGCGIILTNVCKSRMKELSASYITLRCSAQVKGFYDKLGFLDCGYSMKYL